MITTVYLLRHSEPFKVHRGIEIIDDDFLTINKKTPLSVDGEHLAEGISQNSEFENIDIIWSSDYVRTMSTAKYIAFKNNLKVNINKDLGERIHGVDKVSEIPSDFEIRQFTDENYKLLNGESRKEVSQRLYRCLINIINDNKGKKIVIVGHSTATAYLLSNWCEISYDSNYKFKGKTFFDGKWNYCQTFKLKFENNELTSIEDIKVNSKI